MQYILLDESGDLGFNPKVDFVSWAIFRRYEKEDSLYYNLIKDKVVEENSLFP